jgi:hypothetical protein
MPPQHTDPTEIAGVARVGRGNDTRKGYRICRMTNEPPMAVIEFRNGGAIEERQTVEFRERIRDLIVMPVDFANPIHWSNLRIIFRVSL